jgi:hypothetical protein
LAPYPKAGVTTRMLLTAVMVLPTFAQDDRGTSAEGG